MQINYYYYYYVVVHSATKYSCGSEQELGNGWSLLPSALTEQ